MAGREKRFEVTYSQEFTFSVVVDRRTGVNYLMTDSGITPLLDSEGKPLVTLAEEK